MVRRRHDDQRSTGAAIEIDDERQALGLALLRIRKHLARPLRQPTVGDLDLPHGHRAGIGQRQQQRVAVRRVARHADGQRREVVGHGLHGALHHLGQPVIGVDLLPQRRRRKPPREPVHEDQLLADSQTPLQQLRLDACELDVALEQRLQAHRVLLPKPLPHRDRLLGGLELSVAGGLRLSRIPARELGMQMEHRLAEHFGERGALARRDRGRRQRAQLSDQSLVGLRDRQQRQRLRPFLRPVQIRERERRQVVGQRGELRGGLGHQSSAPGPAIVAKLARFISSSKGSRRPPAVRAGA